MAKFPNKTQTKIFHHSPKITSKSIIFPIRQSLTKTPQIPPSHPIPPQQPTPTYPKMYKMPNIPHKHKNKTLQQMWSVSLWVWSLLSLAGCLYRFEELCVFCVFCWDFVADWVCYVCFYWCFQLEVESEWEYSSENEGEFVFCIRRLVCGCFGEFVRFIFLYLRACLSYLAQLERSIDASAFFWQYRQSE